MADDAKRAGDPRERRRAPRYRVDAPARYRNGRFEGTGEISELSKRGLRIDAASLRVAVGQHIRVSFALMRTSLPIVIPCVVVRTWERGFAAEFGELDARHRNSLQLALAQLKQRRSQGEDETAITILRAQQGRKREPV